MKIILVERVKEAVADLCLRANFVLRDDVLAALKIAHKKETNKRAKDILAAIIENAAIARKERIAICQDTGLPTVILDIGQEVKIRGDLRAAINRGIEEGYKKGALRNSIVANPLLRGKPGCFPGVIHSDIVKGDRIKITFLPKGFGCENKTQLKMFNPTAAINEIKDFIVGAVKNAGSDACPPFVIGVGIGGTADYAVYLAKKALLRKVTLHFPACRLASRRSRGQAGRVGNSCYTLPSVASLERDLLADINKLNIGPMGLGGKTTALGVNIETYPTHIAGLPVAVNISCHALRGATTEI